jgi:hypothetical protein
MLVIDFDILFEEDNLSNPQAILDFNNLRVSLASLPGIEFYDSLMSDMHIVEASNSLNGSDGIDKDFRFHVPADRLKPVIGILFDWLGRISPRASIEASISPEVTLAIDVKNPRDIIYLDRLIGLFLPAEYVYLAKAKAYVDEYGELTPAADANLSFLRHQLAVSSEIAEDINYSASGIFRKLDEKYSYFRRELLKYKNEILPARINEAFPSIMREKAEYLALPEADAIFLWNEFYEAIQHEAAEKIRKDREKEIFDKQQEAIGQQQLTAYGNVLKQILQGQPHPSTLGVNPRKDQISSFKPEFSESSHSSQEFNQKLVNEISLSEFDRGQIEASRDYFSVSVQDAKAIEARIFDEMVS